MSHHVRTPRFTLQFDLQQIPALAARYSYPDEERIIQEISPAVRKRGHYTRSELIEVCRWKTQRSRSRVAANNSADVIEATRLALTAESERLRIWTLMALAGVSWPTASVLLHFGHHDRYPILDYRALEALGATGHTYTIDFWLSYVEACRAIDDRTGLGMRTIDRAMWQWSKERPASQMAPPQAKSRQIA